MNRRAIAASFALTLAATACTGDAPTVPDSTSPTLDRGGTGTRSSTSQGIARVERVGDPIWRPLDFHLFTAPLGTFEEFIAVGGTLFPPPNHVITPEGFIVPGAPHEPPYDREVAEGMVRAGYVDRHSFPASAFSAESGNGIVLVWMLVPEPGVIGSSPDFAAGPILPDELFPIVVSGDAFRNGELYDPFFDFEIPSLAEAAPEFAELGGYSHTMVLIGESEAFEPDPALPPWGRYRIVLALRDQAGNGWDITVQFIVRKKG